MKLVEQLMMPHSYTLTCLTHKVSTRTFHNLHMSFTMSPFTTGPLNVDKHLKMVREVTWDVRAKWYDIGVELKVNLGTLEVSL